MSTNGHHSLSDSDIAQLIDRESGANFFAITRNSFHLLGRVASFEEISIKDAVSLSFYILPKQAVMDKLPKGIERLQMMNETARVMHKPFQVAVIAFLIYVPVVVALSIFEAVTNAAASTLLYTLLYGGLISFFLSLFCLAHFWLIQLNAVVERLNNFENQLDTGFQWRVESRTRLIIFSKFFMPNGGRHRPYAVIKFNMKGHPYP